MTATELQQRLTRVKAKSTVLVEKYRQLLELKQSAEARLAEAERDNAQLRQQVAELQRQNANLRTARTLATTPDEAKQTRLMINRLVRDIDKCIAQLNT